LTAFLAKTGCFVAGTLCWVSSPVSAAVAEGLTIRPLEGTAPALKSDETAIPIQDVALGQRVPRRNPFPEEHYHPADDRVYFGWKVIHALVRHANGSIVDVQLLRPEDWIERNGLRAGQTINLGLTEIELDASAFVVSIDDGPEVRSSSARAAIRFGLRLGWNGAAWANSSPTS
jgi:hypothetical protein